MTPRLQSAATARYGTPLVLALIAIAFSSLLVVRSLSQVDWDATEYTAFGEEAIPTRDYAEERLGEVFLRPEQGHDGKFFFVQANDPWLLDPEINASVLDRPLYRSQRMFYPMLAGAGGLFSPEVIVWSMIAVNVLALGAGTYATAMVAKQMGMSTWWGLAFTLNVGFISEMNIDGAGILAAALAFGAVALVQQRRTTAAIVLLVLAALSREAMVIAAAGTAWWLWRFHDQKREAALVIAFPLAAIVLWALYLRFRIGFDTGASQVEEIGLPFVGFVEALDGWRSDPLDMVVGVGIMLFMAVFAVRALRSDQLVGWAFLGFCALGVLFTEQVWQSYFDITRAIAPIITAAFILLALRRDLDSAAFFKRTGVRL